MNRKEKRIIINRGFLLFIIMFAIVLLSSYRATLAFENEGLVSENERLIVDRENVEIKIKEYSHPMYIENAAINELGMVRATATEMIFISETEEVNADLAISIINEAY